MKLLTLALFLSSIASADQSLKKIDEKARANEIYNFRKADSLQPGWSKLIGCYQAAREARKSFGVDTGEIFEAQTAPNFFYSMYALSDLGEIPGDKNPARLFVFNLEGASVYNLAEHCDDGSYNCLHAFNVRPPGSEEGKIACLQIIYSNGVTGDRTPDKNPRYFSQKQQSQKLMRECETPPSGLLKTNVQDSTKILQETYNMIYDYAEDLVREVGKGALSQRKKPDPAAGDFKKQERAFAVQNKLTETMLNACEGVPPTTHPSFIVGDLAKELSRTKELYLSSIGQSSQAPQAPNAESQSPTPGQGKTQKPAGTN